MEGLGRRFGWLYHGTLIVIWAQDIHWLLGTMTGLFPTLLFTAVKIVPGDGNPSLRGQTTGQSPRLNYAGIQGTARTLLAITKRRPVILSVGSHPFFPERRRCDRMGRVRVQAQLPLKRL